MTRWERATARAASVGDGTAGRLARERNRVGAMRRRLLARPALMANAVELLALLEPLAEDAVGLAESLEAVRGDMDRVPGFAREFSSVEWRFVDALGALTVLRSRLAGVVSAEG